MRDLKKRTRLGFRMMARNIGVAWDIENPEKIEEDMKAKLGEFITSSKKVDKFAVLAFDGAYDEQGEIIHESSVMMTTNEKLYEFAGKYKDRVLPAPSINPQRKDAMEQLELAVAQGSVLIKLLPGIQLIDLGDPKFKKFFEAVAESELPLLVHIGQEYAFPGMKLIDEYNTFEKLEQALQIGCKVIGAHNGGYALTQKGEIERIQQLKQYLEKYPNLYLDNSAMIAIHRRRSMISLLGDDLLQERTFFGTDFPVPNFPSVFMDKFGVAKYRELSRISNPFDRDVETKRALGLSEESFHRFGEMLSKRSK